MSADVILSQTEAEERLAYWQDVLRLRDWEISICIVRRHDMYLDGLAEASWQIKKRIAIIRLLDPVDFDPGWFGSRDMELSLVHELLHLHLAPWSPEEDTVNDVYEEQAIHAMSSAMIRLKRSPKAA